MAANTNLIPTNVMDEFKKRMQESRGYGAKRADARRFVFTTLVARFGNHWWHMNNEKLLSEMQVVEDSLRSKPVLDPIGDRPVSPTNGTR